MFITSEALVDSQTDKMIDVSWLKETSPKIYFEQEPKKNMFPPKRFGLTDGCKDIRFQTKKCIVQLCCRIRYLFHFEILNIIKELQHPEFQLVNNKYRNRCSNDSAK